jgi:pyruvate/2-oxoglutarate dehydrogenase complex dihydrolipoamide acyltransferase (E2) component
MGNSPSASPASAPAPASAPSPAAAAPAAAPAAASLASDSKKENNKTVVQVPAENVVISKGGKHRRLKGGMASVHFDLVPRLQPSDGVMERATSLSQSGIVKGGKRRRTHKKRRSLRRHRSRHYRK